MTDPRPSQCSHEVSDSSRETPDVVLDCYPYACSGRCNITPEDCTLIFLNLSLKIMFSRQLMLNHTRRMQVAVYAWPTWATPELCCVRAVRRCR
eukprot:33967-Eustigmatos_ZCMA.PRE.1